MSTDQIPTEQVWGAPQPSPRRWGLRETVAAVGVAAVIAALGGAAIYAATDGSSQSFGAPRPAFGSGGGMPNGPGVPPTSLHGEFVVPDGAGGFTTELTQTGTVTAISPTSITVRSEDGNSQTYAIPKAGNANAPFAVDERVVVRATRNGQTATVTTIGNPPPSGSGAPARPAHRN
jgi:hypothetical protein